MCVAVTANLLIMTYHFNGHFYKLVRKVEKAISPTEKNWKNVAYAVYPKYIMNQNRQLEKEFQVIFLSLDSDFTGPNISFILSGTQKKAYKLFNFSTNIMTSANKL